MYYEPLLIFLVLFICARLMALRLPFFSAAILAVAGVYLVESVFRDTEFAPFWTGETALRLVIAWILFFLIDRAEKKTGRWIILLVTTWAIFTYLL